MNMHYRYRHRHSLGERVLAAEKVALVVAAGYLYRYLLAEGALTARNVILIPHLIIDSYS
jgi:hypothetical protein